MWVSSVPFVQQMPKPPNKKNTHSFHTLSYDSSLSIILFFSIFYCRLFLPHIICYIISISSDLVIFKTFPSFIPCQDKIFFFFQSRIIHSHPFCTMNNYPTCTATRMISTQCRRICLYHGCPTSSMTTTMISILIMYRMDTLTSYLINLHLILFGNILPIIIIICILLLITYLVRT